MSGYWVFWKPKGYRYEKTRDQGKMLIRDEPIASIIQEALEGFEPPRVYRRLQIEDNWSYGTQQESKQIFT